MKLDDIKRSLRKDGWFHRWLRREAKIVKLPLGCDFLHLNRVKMKLKVLYSSIVVLC